MAASKRLTLCAIALFAAVFASVNNATAGNAGSSHAISAPQQKSVRQSADIKLPNKAATSRKLQKRDASAVKKPADQQLLKDFSRADAARKAAEQKKQQDDIEKQKQEKAKELQDLREQEAKKYGQEQPNIDATRQKQQEKDDQNALTDPIGFIEKQFKDGTTSHDPQPNRSDNFSQDIKDIAKGASEAGEITKGGTGRGFGEIAKDAMDKATKDRTPAHLRDCANC